MKFGYILISLVLCSFVSKAAPVDDARHFMELEDYNSALEIINSELDKKLKTSVKAELEYLAGECYYRLYDFESAKECLEYAKVKDVPDAFICDGRIAFKEYRFVDALDSYAKYDKLINKKRKEVPQYIDDEVNIILKAQDMLDRVEHIIILDSMSVNKSEFLIYYKLTPESGSISTLGELGITDDADVETMTFCNEDKDFAVWVSTDTIGNTRLKESIKLIGGGWQIPIEVDSTLNEGGDIAYPFMLSDGQTLYFANNGENSIGGFDIFRSNRDADTGEYMSPINIGMPYNSPYDDYMLAIDECLGVGWWATNRNSPNSDMITIYIYKINDIRKNHYADDILIADFAKVSNYKLTWGNDDYSGLVEDIKRSQNLITGEIIPDFIFPIGNGVVYNSLDDFSTDEGRNMMKLYLELEDAYTEYSQILSEKRRKYHNRKSQASGQEIVKYEHKIEQLRERLKSVRSRIIKLEK